MPDSQSYTRIKKLSPLLINQLAAGEVVTRPAAVVKELLENAIDAGASRIEIRITQGGMGMIEVIDNGLGIHPDDMVMAVTRHATSKVADVANLHGITTLGFRGEALAATAAVSRLTLTSSHDDSGIGRQLQVAGVLAETPTLTPVVHDMGTSVTVKDLYFNVPARRGNLKSIATEFAHIETIVREVALARADIGLELYHDNKKRLSLSAISHSDLSDKSADDLSLARLEQALGRVLDEQAIAISVDLSSLLQPSSAALDSGRSSTNARIQGWLWPMTDPQDTLPKLLYINGRLIKEPIISNQLRQWAQSAGLKSIGYALYFELPLQWLNVNVHPSKQRIKISPLNNLIAHLGHNIRLKLKTLNESKSVAGHASLNKNIINEALYNKGSFYKSFAKKAYPSFKVKTPKQDYQYLDSRLQSKQPLDQPIHTNFSRLGADKKSAVDAPNKESLPFLDLANKAWVYQAKAATINSKICLPHCLDIINNLPDSLSESWQSPLSDLPWLLFYNNSQLLLINADAWQAHLQSLLDDTLFFEDKIPTSAAKINQQLSHYTTQMSAQDRQAFKTDLQALLGKKALKTLDTQQLILSMLAHSLI